MKIALIGLPNSGKTTIFNALTKSEAKVSTFSATKREPNLAVVEVVDERVGHLSEMYSPKKTTYATVEFIDFAGLTKGPGEREVFTSTSLGLIKNADALAIVVRNFHNDFLGTPNPLQDIRLINEELLLSDLIITENRLERIALSSKRGVMTTLLENEEKTLRKIDQQLNNNQALRDLQLGENEEKMIRGFQFLTKKPFMVILNSDEKNFRNNQDLLAELKKNHKVIEFCGDFEMELSRLNEEEAKVFMEDIGINESARHRLTRFAFEILGYISFYTVGSDEVRAWNIHKGETALRGAANIHTDLARGFIRAECFSYNDLISCGSAKGIRENGCLRLEGKDYIVNDGDILNIRFNV